MIPRLEVRQLSLMRGSLPVLHKVSFTVAAGEILVVIGPSGSGKSSLLRTLNRLTEFQSGEILLDGQETRQRPVQTLRREIGMIFQKTTLFEGSVADNLQTGARLWGQSLPEARLRELLQQVSLPADLLYRDAATLSGGQEQRLAIARALANEPRVLLLDEPTSSLDPAATIHVEATLRHLRDTLGLTMIWVSHMIEQARRVADRVLLLEGGRVVRVDTVQTMLDPLTGDRRALAFAAGQVKGREDDHA